MKMANIVSALCGDVWCIHPDKLEAICEVINVRLSGGSRSDAEIKAAIAQAKENVSTTIMSPVAIGGRDAARSGDRVDSTGGNVAVLTLYGTLAQRTGAFDSGAVSVERFGKNFDAAMADPSIGSIVIDIDSPGGSVFGIEEMAEKIYAARGRKKIVAVANSFAASGAYWIAAAADDIVVTPGGEVGSVGVFCLHQDLSGAYEQIGVKHTFIKAGKHKAEANPFEQLDPDAKDYIQERVNERYDVFTKAIAKFRGVSAADARENFGQGRMKMAKAAVKTSMADSIGTLDSVIDELLKNKNKSFGARAADRSELTESESKSLGVKKMSKNDETAAVDLESVKAEATQAVKAAETKRANDLQAAFPDDPTFSYSQFAAGASVQEAKAAYCDILAGQLKTEKAKKPAASKTGDDEVSEGADAILAGEGGGGSAGDGDFREQAKAKAKEDKTSFRVAASALAKEDPELYRAYAASHRL